MTEIAITIFLKDPIVCTYIHTYKISVTTLETNLIAVDLERGECENHLDRVDM